MESKKRDDGTGKMPVPKKVKPQRRLTQYERTEAAVRATGNKWAMENFKATHS